MLKVLNKSILWRVLPILFVAPIFAALVLVWWVPRMIEDGAREDAVAAAPKHG